MELVANQKELDQVAKKIIQMAKNHSVIIFKGDLGAGKTTLIKNICTFLEVIDEVSSPTYSLVNEYQDKNGEIIYHFDFYRIESEVEALDIGCEEYFYSGNLCLIEWPEQVESLLPESRLEVIIRTASENENKRVYTLNRIN